MTEDRWDPERYARFRDLLAGTAPVPGGAVIDLGCGTGDLTGTLHEAAQAAGKLGGDRSEAMRPYPFTFPRILLWARRP